MRECAQKRHSAQRRFLVEFNRSSKANKKKRPKKQRRRRHANATVAAAVGIGRAERAAAGAARIFGRCCHDNANQGQQPRSNHRCVFGRPECRIRHHRQNRAKMPFGCVANLLQNSAKSQSRSFPPCAMCVAVAHAPRNAQPQKEGKGRARAGARQPVSGGGRVDHVQTPAQSQSQGKTRVRLRCVCVVFACGHAEFSSVAGRRAQSAFASSNCCGHTRTHTILFDCALCEKKTIARGDLATEPSLVFHSPCRPGLLSQRPKKERIGVMGKC